MTPRILHAPFIIKPLVEGKDLCLGFCLWPVSLYTEPRRQKLVVFE